ncbi:MAG: TetR/AcrR family transcriptional regulator [Propionibacteriaceae bacterium]|jgi:AcrR family transcriptional regulator|nr:TetR/AcrR family transcriptional regulator [Propionibacteriaceae bacterium]
MAKEKRGPYKKSVERRSAILRAALEAYAESDAGGPTLQAIADKVGLTQTALLHYFPNRQELFLGVVRVRDDRDRFRAPDESLSPEDFHRLGQLIARNAETPGLVRLYLEQAVAGAAPTHPAHAYFRDRYQSFVDGLAEGLLAAKGLSQDQAAWLARILIAAADGLQIQWLYDSDISMASDLGRLVDLAVAASRGRPGPTGAPEPRSGRQSRAGSPPPAEG